MSFHSKSNDKKRFGPSLSLHRIANRQRSDYDPREAREKERARAAKTVNKYKKLKKRLLGPEEGAGTGAVATAQVRQLEISQLHALKNINIQLLFCSTGSTARTH